MNEDKKGQKDSEEGESIYEKEGKKGDNDMCRKLTITLKTKWRKKNQAKKKYWWKCSMEQIIKK